MILEQKPIIVYWEGTGLSDKYSGIYRYAQKTFVELKSLGTTPRIIGGRKQQKIFQSSKSRGTKL